MGTPGIYERKTLAGTVFDAVAKVRGRQRWSRGHPTVEAAQARRDTLIREMMAVQAPAVVSVDLALTAGNRFNPWGFFVYILWSNETVIYVGQSTNVFSRVGSHLTSEKSSLLTGVSFIRCESEQEMLQLEWSLIRHYRPRFNLQVTKRRRKIAHRSRLRKVVAAPPWVDRRVAGQM
jgi:predicted GIY-YIG superfamily endonuclease